MRLSERMHQALNDQIGREFRAHFLYRSVAMALYAQGYEGFSAWMDQHAAEEYQHAERIITFLKEKNARVTLPGVETPQQEWKDIRSAVADALEHEKWLTDKIYELHKMADEDNDYSTIILLDWFVDEQKEEEHVVTRLLKRLDLVGNNPVGVMVLDTELRGEADAESGEEGEEA
jgi:ferritin